MSLSSLKIVAQLQATVSKTLGDGSAPTFQYLRGLFTSVPDDATKLFNQGYALTGSGSQSVDFSGSLVDALGEAVVFTTLYALIVINTSTATGKSCTLSGNVGAIFGGTNPTLVLGPNSCLFLANVLDGYTITSSTADTLTITNDTATGITVYVGAIGK